MELFECDRCGSEVSFEAQRCLRCSAELGYVPERLDIEVLEPLEPGAATYQVGPADTRWRCLNAAWGCNWTLSAGTGEIWCRSCRLTRGRPAETDPTAVDAWASAESAKRRLVHQLDSLALPVEGRGPSTPHGLAFDLVHLPGQPALTGHLDGVVTLDLAETDQQHRDQLRLALGEPFRSVIGHLRHEIGHYYWDLLVGADAIDAFRELFGEERADYRRALADHHAAGSSDWDAATFITAYAAAHPLEDWAETFAHLLHIHDAFGTATAHGLTAGKGPVFGPRAHPVNAVDTRAALANWMAIARAANAVAASLGGQAVYPFEPTGVVVEKLAFIHSRIVGLTGRDPFGCI